MYKHYLHKLRLSEWQWKADRTHAVIWVCLFLDGKQKEANTPEGVPDFEKHPYGLSQNRIAGGRGEGPPTKRSQHAYYSKQQLLLATGARGPHPTWQWRARDWDVVASALSDK